MTLPLLVILGLAAFLTLVWVTEHRDRKKDRERW